jgi:parvulin-like peptidyl-prolyl isomerase
MPTFDSQPAAAFEMTIRQRCNVAFLGFWLGFALVGCSDRAPVEERPDPSVVIARYVGGELRRGDIQEAIDRNLASVPQPASPEVRRAIVKKIVERRVRTEMLYAEALAKGYAERPEVRFRQTAAEEQILAEDLLASETSAAKAADAMVVAEVDRRLAASQTEETRKFSHIFLRAAESDAAARASAQETMATIDRELAGGANFNELAEKYSNSVMARGGGRIDWTAKKSLPRAPGDAVFTLAKEGDVSAVVATPDGLHRFRLDGIRTGEAADAAAVNAAVRQELDTEARTQARRSRRQGEIDAHGVEFASADRLASVASSASQAPKEAVPGQSAGQGGAAWVARWNGPAGAGEVSEAEILALKAHVLPTEQPLQSLDIELRYVVENRLLAAIRRAQGATSDLDARLEAARRQVVIDSYRGDLMTALDTPPTEDEIARFHRENAESSIAFRDFEIDVLFFPQTGDDRQGLAEVYSAGEEVGAKLRQGTPFDELLDRPVRKLTQVCRELHGTDVERLGQSSIRLRKALLNLSDGEVSAAIYIERPVTFVPKRCELGGRGVVFVRLRGVGTLALEEARPAILAALSKERVTRGVDEIQARLIADSKLEILLPEG